MAWGRCAGCDAKDGEIARLVELVESLRRENLALVDLKAVSAAFPRKPLPPSPIRKDEDPEPIHASPSQVREGLYTPAQTSEEVEELFAMVDRVDRSDAS